MSHPRNLLLASSLLAALAMTGCATTLSPEARDVTVADEPMVSGCRFLDNVQGSSGWGNLAAETGMRNARNAAREQAAALGATHLVWANVQGGYSPSAFGKAYECEQD